MDTANATWGLSDAAMPAVRAAINSCTDLIQRRALAKPMVTMLTDATPEEDMRHNTDLRISFAADLPVAIRVREHHYLGKYGNEFTLRSRAQYGGRTEAQKAAAGEGTFFFYGFISETGPAKLERWFIGDLDVWRKWCARRKAAGQSTYRFEKNNYDGTAFQAYNIKDLPPEFIVAQFDRARGFAQEALF
jgi:hypothetical protein